MQILVLEKPGLNARRKPCAEHLRAEAARVWELYQAGIVRELYFDRELQQAVLLLECPGTDRAERVLDSLPLVREGLITFDVIPLRPYPGFARLFAGMDRPESHSSRRQSRPKRGRGHQLTKDR